MKWTAVGDDSVCLMWCTLLITYDSEGKIIYVEDMTALVSYGSSKLYREYMNRKKNERHEKCSDTHDFIV